MVSLIKTAWRDPALHAVELRDAFVVNHLSRTMLVMLFRRMGSQIAVPDNLYAIAGAKVVDARAILLDIIEQLCIVRGLGRWAFQPIAFEHATAAQVGPVAITDEPTPREGFA